MKATDKKEQKMTGIEFNFLIKYPLSGGRNNGMDGSTEAVGEIHGRAYI